jgi:hypothetical protein
LKNIQKENKVTEIEKVKVKVGGSNRLVIRYRLDGILYNSMTEAKRALSTQKAGAK